MAFRFRSPIVAVICLLLIVVAGAVVHRAVPQDDPQGSDISFDYIEAQRILAGENPYARILPGDMRTNQKYATYLPLFYLLSAAVIRLGYSDLLPWLSFWRVAFLFFNIGAGALIFALLYRRKLFLTAVFATLFWFFNRWTLRLTAQGTIDYPAIFLLLLAIWLLPKNRIAAFLMLSLSLAFKQLDAILVPLFLIWAWQNPEERPARAVVSAAAAIALPLVVMSLPFFVTSPDGFLKSMLFEMVRDPGTNMNAPSMDMMFGYSGIVGRLPMLLMLGLVYAIFWRGQVGLCTSVLLAFSVFICFNSVLFVQYFNWLMPFIPLAASETFAAFRYPERRQAETRPLVPLDRSDLLE